MRRWTQIFKALANINRLKIIKLLSDDQPRHVTEIADELDISLKATSKHLIILQNLDVLDCKGKNNRVFYFLHKDIPKDFQKAINLF